MYNLEIVKVYIGIISYTIVYLNINFLVHRSYLQSLDFY